MKDHGTRTRYVSGCRCDLCREANRRYAAERGQRAKELAALVSTPTTTSQREWHVHQRGCKRGQLTTTLVTFKRVCMGIDGKGCPSKTAFLKKNSTGTLCSYCREHILSGHQMVEVSKARGIIKTLKRRFGMGLREIAPLVDVDRKALQHIMSGEGKCDRDLEAALEELLVQEDRLDPRKPANRIANLKLKLPNSVPRLKEHFLDEYEGLAGERKLYRDLEMLKAFPDEDGRWRLP